MLLGLKLATFNYIAFAASDTIDVLSGHGYDINKWEYIGFAVTVPFTIWEIRRKIKKKWQSL